jgi:hypothetical protein
MTVARVCRFVVYDGSSKADQITEVEVMCAIRVPMIVLRLSGSPSTFVTSGLSIDSSNITEEALYGGCARAQCWEAHVHRWRRVFSSG